jgi:thioester reductase-like protein/malonyl CoA-acyl carrier protein transacylase/SAM-dependent methyltransferase
MLWMQNLAAGSFVSPTGQCKPFDEDADGYCRAEGMAFVFLKKLPDAVADGNPILATIRTTAVYQNLNSTPLFVPNSPSLLHLFKNVMQAANVKANDVSLVEAHGTGTPVGDPAEYESIRLALGGPVREKVLPIGSVKGHIGHTEGASGVIALVKVIMMMSYGFIPAQASFRKMNHQIQVRPDDMMEVMTSPRPWTEERKIALINNYGACGSNASMVIAQPALKLNGREMAIKTKVLSRFPFRITGLDVRSIAAYSNKLTSWLRLRADRGDEEATLADMSFAMARQSNQALPQGLIFSCGSLTELKEKLLHAASARKENSVATGIRPMEPERPVILCFGGQVSTFIGLDRQLYDSVTLLRCHLNECDTVIRSAGLESIYPDIFRRGPLGDTVKLQTILFAFQYACAKTWMDCGLDGKISAVVGHSFGEITALCVAGALSLADTVKLVAGRAKMVRDAWGPDPGAMMAVEGDETLVQDLLREANCTSDSSASVATYNGPRSFTLAGSTKAINAVSEILAGTSGLYTSIKSKRLNVTNAFHSVLVEGLVDGLGQIGKELTFREPLIPVEHATQSRFTSSLDWTFVPSHMRNPIYFNEAIHRLAGQYPKALFLEAGSSSTITVMAARALALACSNAHHFQSMSISNNLNENATFDSLTDATLTLWKQGLRVSFWPHHPKQAREYAQLLLPPYQFDKSGRHWLEMKSPAEEINKAAEAIVATRGLTTRARETEAQPQPQPLDMYSFVSYKDKKKRRPRFCINTSSEKYKYYFSGHVIANTAPICPATVESDIAIEALFTLHPEWKSAGLSPVLRNLANYSPICANPARAVYVDFDAQDDGMKQWGVKIFSASAAVDTKDIQMHVEARLHFCSPTDPDFIQEFARYERLVNHSRCQALLTLGLGDEQDDHGIDVLRGRNIYRAFKDIVDYPEIYRGVRSVVGRGNESAGIVTKRHQGKTWLDVTLSDSFGQVGGMWVNLMTETPLGEMYIAAGCEVLMRSPTVKTATNGKEHGPSLWHVFAQHSPKSDKEYMTDVFVFDPSDGTMHQAMLGFQYVRVAKESMSKMLTRLTADELVLRVTKQLPSLPTKIPNKSVAVAVPSATMSSDEFIGVKPSKKETGKKEKPPRRRRDITDEVHELVANVAGIDPDDFTLDTEMADLGIDSLMGMELAREVEIVLKCTIDQAEQMQATSLRQFVVCVSNALARAEGGGLEEDDESDDSDEDNTWTSPSRSDFDTSISTPNEEENLTASEKPNKQIRGTAHAAKPISAASSNLTLTRSDILECFGEVKMLTDELITAHHLDTIHKTEIAGSNRLCTVLAIEAMEKLGMSIGTAASGQVLDRVPFLPQHRRLMDCVYGFLERDARLIDIDPFSGQLTRTHVAVSPKSSRVVLQELLEAQPNFAVPNRLTYYAGQTLADVLSGKTDGIRVLFGTTEGRELTQAMYCEHSFNCMNYMQMRNVISRLIDRVKCTQPGETLKILEMGAGTGGTTMIIAPFLASIAQELSVEYTFTDLSPSMVANARRTFGKQYPFMRFAVHDIEAPPADENKGQHIVLASNAVHATRNLVTSARNIRQTLRDDGFMMILEMTEVVPFVDLVFGLLEGWWLFDDGRTHAVVTAEHWERELHTAGFGHVDWTDGALPENAFQKVIMALASGEPEADRLPKALPSAAVEVGPSLSDIGDLKAREAEAEDFVKRYSQGWATPELDDAARDQYVYAAPARAATVLVTGATGSLGSHLVEQLANHPDLTTIVCINRPSSMPVEKRQEDAFSSRGIELPPGACKKLRILEADTSLPHLGLASHEYKWLQEHGTHVVHNAWPMSATRPIQAFESQFKVLRNLLDLARSMAVRGNPNSRVRIGFQFVSSIGVVGYSSERRVLERHVPMAAVMLGGYTEAKWACERLLNETLGRYPKIFRPMVVRPGQIAGSTKSGVWNPVEHFACLVKSAQTMRVWPDFDGILQWLPVDNCAEVMVDLLKIGNEESAPDAHAVYHIDNPVGQPWKAMSPVLSAAIDIPQDGIIPFKSWIKRVRRSPLPETDNPAARLVDFLEFHFQRMSCGGLILDTTRAQEHSETMAKQGPVGAEVARLYVAAWKKMGFLHP